MAEFRLTKDQNYVKYTHYMRAIEKQGGVE